MVGSTIGSITVGLDSGPQENDGKDDPSSMADSDRRRRLPNFCNGEDDRVVGKFWFSSVN